MFGTHHRTITFTITCVGIQPWEEKYVEMAEAMGIDPKVDDTILLVHRATL